MDSEKLNEVISAVQAAKTVLVNSEDNIYSAIDNMSSGWEGGGYDQYKSNANDYRGALNSVNLFLEAFVAMLEQVEEAFNIELPKINAALDMQ